MSIAIAPAPRPSATRPTGSAPVAPMRAGSTMAAQRAVAVPQRSYEIAALRADGSLFIGQDRGPALPVFESAFAAFARGTPVQTEQGEVPIEDLQPGDKVVTSEGDTADLVWIGSSSFVPADADRRMPLVRIMPDSFGEARPSSFVTVGPAARVLQTPHHLSGDAAGARMFTPLREFVDGVNIIEVVPPTPVRLFHLCLDRHCAIRVGGLEMETFHPGSKAFLDLSEGLRARFLGMFPRIAQVTDFGPLAHPRAPETTG